MTSYTPWDERYLPRVGSTMEWARQVTAAEELRRAPVDAVRVRTGEQLTGRGRRGAPWWDTPGASVLTTLALRRGGVWDPGDPNPASMALRAGLAVARTLERCDIAGVGIKWPNDILLNQRKVCGILVEADPRWFYIGIGLNVGLPSRRPHPSRLSHPSRGPHSAGEPAILPGSIAAMLSRSTGVATIVQTLDQILAQVVRTGNWLPEVRRRLVWQGRMVRLQRESSGEVIGILTGLDEAGAVLIASESGAPPARYMAGTLRPAEGD